ncbi:MAG: thioredoxin family protein [Candidatus Eisenbacteria bacterium]|uniref:Thioredoxin family protein n=1 Tax=Eiseniibacteriota bacterium TaxID=2212470 RepID=A0A956LWS1_UNCEI|nr:thioredoxin family protein [Candidatus Eisenbacteria bacterium]
MNPVWIRRLAALALVPLIAGVATLSSQAKDEAMAPSAEVGKQAPNFTLTDTEGHQHSLADYKGKVVVLEWFNPDCPFVKKHHELHHSMIECANKAQETGVVWLAVNSGAPGKQGAGLERNVAARAEYEMKYPVLLDEDGKVGKMYGARTTPHMFVIAADGSLAYQGAIDDNPSPTELGDLNYVMAALNALQNGKAIGTANTKSYGCSVKYAS